MAASEAAAAEAPKATVVSKGLEEVVVHPLVLLSVVDHFRRIEEVRSSSPPIPFPLANDIACVCVGIISLLRVVCTAAAVSSRSNNAKGKKNNPMSQIKFLKKGK